uniref:Uncharacterized protein n=1 Tax=Micrurus spixii TaxID=129469 RepID=A0A2D4MXE0_9SAUR
MSCVLAYTVQSRIKLSPTGTHNDSHQSFLSRKLEQEHNGVERKDAPPAQNASSHPWLRLTFSRSFAQLPSVLISPQGRAGLSDAGWRCFAPGKRRSLGSDRWRGCAYISG